jgi:diguanylate cyclase (GGDEF)-like protein
MDSLTLLANASGLDVRLREEARSSQASGNGFGLVLFDVDEFKPFNDRHGHAAGDALLAALARQVQAEAEAGDYAARYSADGLGLVLRRAPAQAVLAAAERVRAAVAGTNLSLGKLLEPQGRFGNGTPPLPPSPANAPFQSGLARLRAGQLSAAAEAFRAALQLDADHTASIMELAYLDLRQSLSAAQLAGNFQVTLSGGVSTYQAGDTAETLIARADAALGRAKQGGRNQVQLEA